MEFQFGYYNHQWNQKPSQVKRKWKVKIQDSNRDFHRLENMLVKSKKHLSTSPLLFSLTSMHLAVLAVTMKIEQTQSSTTTISTTTYLPQPPHFAYSRNQLTRRRKKQENHVIEQSKGGQGLVNGKQEKGAEMAKCCSLSHHHLKSLQREAKSTKEREKYRLQ